MSKWKFLGFKVHRLEQMNEYGINLSIHERTLVDDFNKMDNPHIVLQQIVGHPRGTLTEMVEKVAMSVIQWFGTNVGRGFFEAAKQKADHQCETLMEVQTTLRRHNRDKVLERCQR